MTYTRCATVLLAVLLLTSSAFPANDAELARQLVEQLYTPQGVLPIKDMIVELEDNQAQETGPANLVIRAKTRIYYKFPNKLRVDQVHNDPNSPLDGKMTILIRDGDNSWIYVAEGQYPAEKGSDSQAPTLALPFNVQKYRIDSERQYLYQGKVRFDGRLLHKVRVTNPAQKDWTATVWIDPAMRVPVQLETTLPTGEAAPPAEEGAPPAPPPILTKKVVYRDFRKLPDGRHLPFQIELYEENVLKIVKIYKGVKVNAGLDDSLFEPMKEFIR
ncbi:MAG: hypothetical protein HY319_12195 [Armatimonadetes bacterium]|nr:hypothetical protein [Armatimonadota bacterium]